MPNGSRPRRSAAVTGLLGRARSLETGREGSQSKIEHAQETAASAGPDTGHNLSESDKSAAVLAHPTSHGPSHRPASPGAVTSLSPDSDNSDYVRLAANLNAMSALFSRRRWKALQGPARSSFIPIPVVSVWPLIEPTGLCLVA